MKKKQETTGRVGSEKVAEIVTEQVIKGLEMGHVPPKPQKLLPPSNKNFDPDAPYNFFMNKGGN